jgi:hypothetical protein
MRRDALRRVTVRTPSIETGYFHKWGISKETIKVDGKNINLSVTKAIIELEDGQIVELIPSNIKFES